ncbi:MAG: arsenate reductase [Sphingobacteriia bacterium]|nr:arsenate reductase [Sphingobacteriia bacterium]
MLTIYHYPKCKTSRNGLSYLQSSSKAFQIRLFHTDILSESDIERLLQKLNIEPQELVRKNDPYYKERLKGLTFNRKEWIKILSQQPSLIKRPIIESEYKAVIGDHLENIDLIIGKL